MLNNRKLKKLFKILSGMDSALVAYSGGVDSTFLLKAAADVLGQKLLAVTAAGPIYPAHEAACARRTARALGVRHIIIRPDVLSDREFKANPPERCYLCKRRLFSRLLELAGQQHAEAVFDGANKDDARDYRPGLRAAAELKIRSPLREAGLTKDEIRHLSRKLKLPTWNSPSMACLASRIPFGTELTVENLCRVDRAEAYLRKLGFAQVRVRHHDAIARIEVPGADLPRLSAPALRRKIVSYLKRLGYGYITLDLQGYRTGSLNEVL
jgi:uncharacterized protein